MAGDRDLERAAALFQRAYEAQMSGDLDRAEQLYKQSIGVRPTAEAHTFLGWTYSFRGALQSAIAECKKAIELDPNFGNPYNDIGAYLLEMGRVDEAIPWLEQATQATRYEAPHYPRFNLGRAYLMKEMYTRALQEFERAAEIAPDYESARRTVEALKRRLN
jgi:Tfp pilus assembly protein PilF